ncbi:MAG: NADH-quinone oxidoreductase subunit J [Chloroflexota bacterium]|nr:MAG: NADH-quinone oxidoreductase subunit J [Chloroflexota bacterium]
MVDLGIVFFLVVALAAIFSAAMVVTLRNPVHCALFLVLTLFCVAIMFLSLSAEFLAAVQVLVYAGAIMVLFLFVITLLNPLQPESPDRLRNQTLFTGGLALILLIEFWLIVQSGALAVLPGTAPKLSDVPNIEALGLALFSTYVVPFEVTSIVLLVAMVGAVVLARGRVR